MGVAGKHRGNKSHYTLTDIYEIIDTIGSDSLRKVISGRTDGLDNKVKSKPSDLEKIGKELGWDQTALNRAIKMELEKRDSD